MSFDPEKVVRLDCDGWVYPDGTYKVVMVTAENGEFVPASDYDQLLALYREAVKPLSRQEKDFAWRQLAGNLRGDEIAEGIIRRRRETVGTR